MSKIQNSFLTLSGERMYMKNIISKLSLFLLILSSCTKDKAVIIPKDTFSEVLAEMYLADQYIAQNYSNVFLGDTVAIYEGIFNKHGYTYTDYNNSMAHYLKRSDRLVKIYKNSRTILEKKRDKIQAEINRLEERKVNWPTLREARSKSIEQLQEYHHLKSLRILFDGVEPPKYSPSLEDFRKDSTSLFMYIFNTIDMEISDSLYVKMLTK